MDILTDPCSLPLLLFSHLWGAPFDHCLAFLVLCSSAASLRVTLDAESCRRSTPARHDGGQAFHFPRLDLGKSSLRVRPLNSLPFLILDFPLGLLSGLSNCFHAANCFCSLVHQGEFCILGWMMLSICVCCWCSWAAENKILTLRSFRNNSMGILSC